jgi:hypothetical protein
MIPITLRSIHLKCPFGSPCPNLICSPILYLPQQLTRAANGIFFLIVANLNSESHFMSPWIQTASGLKFPLLDIDPEAIVIKDIAHALSMLCRFNAHCLKFYSVAEHSVHVSYEIEPRLALLGLMHDAAEAYLGDVPSPLKGELRDFKCIEERLIVAIGERFGFPLPDDGSDDTRELKRADLQLLIDEKAVIMAPEPEPWRPNAPSVKDPSRIECWSPEIAKTRFMARFKELQKV